MSVTITSVTPTTVEATGGRWLKLKGTFERGTKHNVHIGPNGNTTDPKAYSGKAGQGNDIYPLNAKEMWAYTPQLDVGGPYKIHVVQVTTNLTSTLSSALTAAKPHHKSSVFALRSVQPPKYNTGPRNMSLLPAVWQAKKIGLMQALTSAIGESDAEIGGFYLTRLTSALQTGTALAQVYTWDGDLTVTTPDASEVAAGDWIRLDVDGQYFEIASITEGTPDVVTIKNTYNFVIPTGTTPSSKAVTSLPVETTLNWADSGKVGVDGIVYHYTSKTATSFAGVTHIAGGISRPGIRKLHRVESPVMDLNRNRNALDLVRRAMLVDYAEGEHLNAQGRNLGVPRIAFIKGDDVFRKVIKALAYNPKGTIYGLELALTALVGDGNYEISEDLISHPCTIFIKLVGTAATDDVSHGKAYLEGRENQPATSNTTVDIDAQPISRGVVSSVRWKDEQVLTETKTAYPSTQEIEEYDGDSGTQIWALNAGVEGTDVTILTADGGAIEFGTTTANCYYQHKARVQPESKVYFEVLASIPSGVTLSTTTPYAGLTSSDQSRVVGVGFVQVDANNFAVGFANMATNTLLGSAVGSFDKGSYHSVVLQRGGTGNTVQLLVDGIVLDELAYASFPATGGSTEHDFEFGIFGSPGTAQKLRVRQTSFVTKTLTDYWNTRGAAAAVSSAGDADRLDVNVAGHFVAADVGKAIRIFGSSVAGKTNNGRFVIAERISDEVVRLEGRGQKNAAATTGTRIVVPTTGQIFQYPDDVGKKITISNAINSQNNGSFVIDKLLQMGSLADLDAGLSPVPEKTNICEVAGASFAIESGMDWRVDPAFVDETGLDWEMSDAGSISGTTLTLRQALPIVTGGYTRVLAIRYSRVLSAQLLKDNSVDNEVTQEEPALLFAYYPFYLSDPLGFVKTYADAVTAAGMIPDFTVE